MPYMKRNFVKYALVGTMLAGTFSCTKLDPNVYDQAAQFWQTPEQIAAGIAPAYSDLRGYPSGDIFSLQEVTSDEIIVPTRGSDWFDNGDWQQLWLHTWTINHGMINGSWGYIYGGIARVNLILKTVSELNPQPADIASINAELKTIRAFYYYLALDLFGKVPIVENYEADLTTLANKSREEVYAFVEKELTDNVENLPADVNGTTYGRMTKYFGYALLAKLYLNAQVYKGAPEYAKCIAACNKVMEGPYSLEANFFDNFKIANEASKENIFVIPFDANKGLGGLNFQMRTLHYQSNETFNLAASPWNGFCSTADFYNKFAANDNRRNMFLVGQQYSKAGVPLQDKQVNLPLVFDPNVPVIQSDAATFRMAGARSVKYEPTPNTGGDMSNDYAVFRLADVILMKAEAQLRSGDAGGAVTTLNTAFNGVTIRSRAGQANFTTATLDDILNERAREMAWEGWRRNDLIRFGKFNDARNPAKAVSPAFRQLFPIPKAQLDRNPNLTQNTGY